LQLQENIAKPHNIWHSVKNSEIDGKAGEIKAKIATETYMVQCQKSKFVKNVAATCPLCGTEMSLHTCLYKIK
jgi:ubiquinone biosynthesis protein Coq4